VRIGITDSGVGGLSVCAELEARLSQLPLKQDIEVLYLNAAIEDDYAYNSMPDRRTRLQAFDRFLHSVRDKYQPDLLFIACNTLSVLFRDPYFDHHRHVPIKGIVGTGIREMLRAFERQHDLTFIIFASPATIQEGVYGTRLKSHGVPDQQVCEQACPGLPDAISNDGSGRLASELLEKFVPAALQKLGGRPENVLAFLGCTHYGYQALQFELALQAQLPKVTVMNPNLKAVDTILASLDNQAGSGDLTIKFISRYAIPPVVIKSLSAYIGIKAPATLAALKNFTLEPELCGEL
jgi:glutamate racemase